MIIAVGSIRMISLRLNSDLDREDVMIIEQSALPVQ
jgi:hypothetical protein